MTYVNKLRVGFRWRSAGRECTDRLLLFSTEL